MKRLFKYLFLIPVALIILALAAANRHLVTIFLDPFAGSTPEGTEIVMPLYIVMLLSVVTGVVIGSFTTWLEQGKYRRAARRARNEADALRADIARLRPTESRKI